MLIAKIKRFLGLGLLLALALGISANQLSAAEAGGGDDATALIMAAQDGHVEAVRLLLAAGANVNLQAQNGVTALIMAAQNGHADVIRLLLANGANVNMQRPNGGTALMSAAYNGHADVIRLLLAAGANVDMQRSDGVTALMSAAYNGHVEAVRLLLAAGAELLVGPAGGELSAAENAMIQTALTELEARKVAFLAAAEAGNLAKINELIELPIRGDRRLVMNQALLAVAQNSDLENAQFGAIMQQLLTHGADINYAELITVGVSESKDGGGAAEAPKELMTALDLAIQQNNAARVQFLITHGANSLSLSNSTQERLAPFTLVTSKSDAGAYAAELANNRALKKIEMQAWEMPEADQERYLDQAFAIAQIIQDKIIEISFELPKEDRERRLMAREDRR